MAGGYVRDAAGRPKKIRGDSRPGTVRSITLHLIYQKDFANVL